MTYVALEIRRQMILWLVARTTACAMTRYAVIGRTGIVNPGAADEGGRGMAEMTIQAGWNVGGIGLCIHPGRRNAMTGIAIIHDANMVDYCRDEAIGGMADTAILVGLNMTIYFTLGE